MNEYLQKINNDFENLKNDYSKKHKNGTDIEGVMWFLVENKDIKTWWWSYEFIGKTTSRGHFLSHRSPARASDLAIKYPELVEDRKIGNLKVYRLRRENPEKIKEFLNIK